MENAEWQEIIAANNTLTDQEKHFNTLCTEYRKFASGWLLATFSGAGFVLTNANSLPYPQELLIALLGYAGSVGMVTLWNIDIGLYHRLLDAAFTEGLKLEENYPQLPQTRHNMVKLQGGRGIQPRVSWFYSLPIFILLFIATWNLDVYLGISGWAAWGLWLGTFFVYSAFSSYIRNDNTLNFRRRGKQDS